MRTVRVLTSVLLARLIVACPGVHLPAPVTPVLQAVKLHGRAACPTADGSCPLPTTGTTTWRLDPDYYSNSAGALVWNRRAVIVVDVPALTDLMLSYTARDGQTYAMRESPSAYPGEPGHYGTQHTDSGDTRRWFITVGTHHCVDPTTFHVVDVGRTAGNPQSAPLDVTVKLPYTGGCAPGGAPPPVGMASPSSPSPGSSSGNTATCPQGERLFRICETCQASAGATPIYHYYEACYSNWQTAQTVHGAGCPITQVSGPSQCQLP